MAPRSKREPHKRSRALVVCAWRNRTKHRATPERFAQTLEPQRKRNADLNDVRKSGKGGLLGENSVENRGLMRKDFLSAQKTRLSSLFSKALRSKAGHYLTELHARKAKYLVRKQRSACAIDTIYCIRGLHHF